MFPRGDRREMGMLVRQDGTRPAHSASQGCRLHIRPAEAKHTRAKSPDSNNPGCRIETLQLIRIACKEWVPTLPSEDHDRSVDKMRRAGGATEFARGAGEHLVKRDNPDFPRSAGAALS